MKYPKISIVTPSYNQGAFLEKTIQSVLDQNYSDLEYIVMDGGSSDNSIDIIKKYEKHLTYWVSESDRGQSHAINKGLARATGELMGWLNSDDYYLPNALKKLSKAYLENTSVGAVYGQGHIINQNGDIVYTPRLNPVTYESLFEWSYGNDFMQPSCLFTRKAWQECGPLDENIHFSLDVDLWIKIAKRYRFKRIKDILSHALSHYGAKTTSYRNLMFVDLAICYMKHGGTDAARRVLEDQANLLSEKESLIRYMESSPFLKPLLSFVKRKIKKQSVSSVGKVQDS